MATSKTLSPTNVTISIPAMTDVPDASVFSNCVDKEADAINTVNTNLNTRINQSFTAISDCNSAYQNGLTLYTYGSTTTNRPSSSSYGTLMVIASIAQTNIWVRQLAFGTGDSTKIYSRMKINDGGWTPWSTFSAS